jgi:hypothetical protein
VDRGHISEIEQLYDRAINDAAIPLLTTPRPGPVTDFRPPSKAPVKRWLTRQTSISMRWKATTARSPRSPTIACGVRMAIRPSTIHRRSRYSAGQRAAPLQLAHLFGADRQQNFRVNETHPAAPCVIVDQQKGVATLACS